MMQNTLHNFVNFVRIYWFVLIGHVEDITKAAAFYRRQLAVGFNLTMD
jgi:hypothetical protein